MSALGDLRYVPTLGLRVSEMLAVEKLPKLTKDNMTPCFLLAPWHSSGALDKSVERIERAYPGRPYFLDIDQHYESPNPKCSAPETFSSLKDPSDAFANWTSFALELPFAIPCLQLRRQTPDDLLKQVDRCEEQGRFYCARVLKDHHTQDEINQTVAVLSQLGGENYCVILEGGWIENALDLKTWFGGQIANMTDRIHPDIPIVISCTSVPKKFDHIHGIEQVSFFNRELCRQLKAQSNQARLIYGDWGSTRAREPNSSEHRPPPRIDYPTSDSWCIAGNKNKDWSFHEAAVEVVGNKNVWCGNLRIWGEDMIRRSASSYPFHQKLGVTAAAKNVAARINIHLHRQAFYDEPDLGTLDLDEDWEERLINQFNF